MTTISQINGPDIATTVETEPSALMGLAASRAVTYGDDGGEPSAYLVLQGADVRGVIIAGHCEPQWISVGDRVRDVYVPRTVGTVTAIGADGRVSVDWGSGARRVETVADLRLA